MVEKEWMVIDKQTGKQTVKRYIRKKKVFFFRLNMSIVEESRSLGSSVLKFTRLQGSSYTFKR